MGADFKYDNSYFRILAQKYPSKAFFPSILDIFGFFRKILHADRIAGADFKFEKSFLKFQTKKYPNMAFVFVPNSGIFIFSRNFAVKQIRGG